MLWVFQVAGITPEFIKNAYSTGRQKIGLAFDPHQVFSLSYIIVYTLPGAVILSYIKGDNMDKITLLTIGRDRGIRQTTEELVHSNADWEVIAASTDEEAVEKFHQYPVDKVLFTDGVRDDEERKLNKIFMHQQPDIIIIRHDGSGGVLLHDEIREALRKRSRENKPTVSFVDDALVNAELNIIVQ